LQRFNVASIRKFACVEDNRLETDVFSASCGVDAIDRHEVLSRTFGLDNPSSRAVSRELLRDCHSTVSIWGSSLAGDHTYRGRPAFTSFIRVTPSA
jgi:hypothetical protein